MLLETQRLILRNFTQEDLPDFCAFAMDPERNRMMGTDDLPDEAAARAAFDWLMEHEQRFYAMEYKETGRVIGNITVGKLPPPVVELPELQGKMGAALSCSLTRDHQRQGLMFEAISALIDHLFSQERMDFVNAGYFDINAASGALQKKLGFTHLLTHEFTRGETTYTVIDNILWNHK